MAKKVKTLKNFEKTFEVNVENKETQTTKIKIINYDTKNLTETEITKPEEYILPKAKPTVSWINICGLHNIDMIKKICKSHDLHPLIIEDILDTTQRSKIDVFENYIFITMKLNLYDKNIKSLLIEQISLILGKNFVITFQEKPSEVFKPVYERLLNAQNKIRQMSADYLAYALIDTVVDNYFHIIEAIGDVIEDIEECVITDPTPKTMRAIHTLKREIIYLRKSVWPLREIINNLQRKTCPLISEETEFHFRDVYDHTIQVIDSVETYRDLLAGILDLYVSSISNRMNEIMKVLTIFAAIFIPLTFIAGLYGMNFNTAKSPFNMPELNWYFGYPLALGIMAIVAIIMLIFFKKRKWL
ncbi:MAG: magnesium transporter [Coxiella sp. DG_40]|nr:MAG: magnesium transporter [Coxiella sp. DG_40]